MKAAYVSSRVYEPGLVPVNPALPYVVVNTSAGLPRNYTLGSSAGSRGIRLSIQLVAETAAGVLFLAQKADDAFLGRSLTAAGWDSAKAVRQVDANPTRDPAGPGSMYALATYVFEATPASEAES